MLRITQSKSASAAKQYFDKVLTKGDYYLNQNQADGQEIVGDWHGIGVEKLGLSGQVDRKSFHALYDNINPQTGEKLTPQNKDARTVGYDFTFDAPKSVSILHAIADGQTKADILHAFRAANHETMRDIEAEMQTRVRTKRQNHDKTTGNIVYGEFIHHTTRPVDGVPDMQLHIHNFVFNATYDESEKKWKAGQFRELKQDAPYYQAAFDTRLAGKLREIGYDIRQTEKGWQIDGVPDSVIEKFSRRTQQIEKAAAEKKENDGIELSPEEKAELGMQTREAKNTSYSMTELQSIWKKRYSDDERDALSVVGQHQQVTPLLPSITAKTALDYAKNHAFERTSTISEKRLMAEALKHGLGSVSVEDVQNELARQQESGDIRTGEHNGQTIVTTREVLREEKAMLDFAKYGRGTCKPLFNGDYQYKSALFQDSTNPLAGKDTSEQKAVIEKVLGSYDRVVGIRGGAGTGKTTVMSEIAHGIREGGRSVFAFAPTARATDMLKSEGFDNAGTLASLLQSEQRQKQVANQVIWLDESALVSTVDMRKLFDIADKQNARVILSGDSKQHQSVSRGDAQRILENYAGMKFYEIKKIRRQKNETYRKAVEDVQNGNMERAFNRLEKLGAFVETNTDDRYKQLADDYLQAVADKKSALVVSPTHKEGEKVTGQIRQELKTQGLLDKKEIDVTRTVNLNWTQAERGNAQKYQQGQVVQFHQNAKGITRGEKLTVKGRNTDGQLVATNAKGKDIVIPLDHASRFNVYETRKLSLANGDKIRITQNGQTENGKRLTNGSLREITGFTKDGDIIVKAGRHGKQHTVISKDYGNLAHGYVVTSHAAQGLTAKIYTDNKAELMENVRDSSTRLSATELMGERAAEQAETMKNYQFYADMRKRNYQLRQSQSQQLTR